MPPHAPRKRGKAQARPRPRGGSISLLSSETSPTGSPRPESGRHLRVRSFTCLRGVLLIFLDSCPDSPRTRDTQESEALVNVVVRHFVDSRCP